MTEAQYSERPRQLVADQRGTRVRFDKDPFAVYLGGLTRNRVCFDHLGRKLKVRHVGPGSVTVTRAGQPRVVGGRAFTPRERTTLAKESVVYLRKPEVTNKAGEEAA